jgi:lycopene cyclase-like protein
VVDARATRLEKHGDATTILTDDGRSHRVRMVVDASGGGSPFVQRVHDRPPAYQTAYGLLLDAPTHGFDPQRMVFMDFRTARRDAPDPPSFLYALPLPDGRLFLEETSLASRPAVSSDLLRLRLESRMQQLGLERCGRLAEEHCSIPMGLGLPTRAQSVVPFGAAASMVHPASGYLMAHVMRKSEPLSESILAGLEQGGATRALAAGNEVVWPSFQRRTWEIYTLGLEALVAMNSEQTTRFFDSFFQLSIEEWYGFLGGTLAPMQLGRIMVRLFGVLPASLRWKLLETSLSTGAAPIARTLLQPGIR